MHAKPLQNPSSVPEAILSLISSPDLTGPRQTPTDPAAFQIQDGIKQSNAIIRSAQSINQSIKQSNTTTSTHKQTNKQTN